MKGPRDEISPLWKHGDLEDLVLRVTDLELCENHDIHVAVYREHLSRRAFASIYADALYLT